MKSFVVLALAVLLGPVALAQHETFAVNPDSSEVKITLITTHEVVNGSFHVQSGSVGFDRGDAKMAGSVVVVAGSGKTGSSMRDKKMTNDILHAGQYGVILFEPKSYAGTIAPQGDSTVQVTGMFTLLGTPHEITVPMVVHFEGAGATAKAHFSIPYVAWGLKNPSFLMWKVENDVAIDLNLVGFLSK